jgi:hypothetical protein
MTERQIDSSVGGPNAGRVGGGNDLALRAAAEASNVDESTLVVPERMELKS